MDGKLTAEEMAQRLIAAQNERQEAVESARAEERAKIEEEKNKEIQELKNMLEVVNSDKEVLTSEKKELKKQLKLISSKVDDEINKGIMDKLAQLDYTPSIQSICDIIDETVGGQVTKLNGIFEALGGEFDDISKQRLYSILMNLENNVELIKKFLNIQDDKLIESEDINSENSIEDSAISSSDNSDNNTKLSFDF